MALGKFSNLKPEPKIPNSFSKYLNQNTRVLWCRLHQKPLHIDLGGGRRCTGSLQIEGPQVYLNLKLRVLKIFGSDFLELKSGSIFYYPNYLTLKNSVNPNAHVSMVARIIVRVPNSNPKSIERFRKEATTRD